MDTEMKQRDSLASEEYFSEESEYLWKILDKFRAKINSPETTEAHRSSLRWTLFRRHFEAWLTDFSAGRRTDELVSKYESVVEDFLRVQNTPEDPWDFAAKDTFVFSLWLVALAILTGLDDKLFDELVKAIGNKGRDAVYDRLVRLRRSDAPQADELMYPEPYEKLWAALQATPGERAEPIERFLDGWYHGMKGTYWYGRHKQLSAGYFGYWCFELAAFVRELDLEDESFIDHPHYPADMVHGDC